MYNLEQFTADHRYLKETVARLAGFSDPVLIDAFGAGDELLSEALAHEPLPIDGVLVTSWRREQRDVEETVDLGMRVYELEGVRFVSVHFQFHDSLPRDGFSFLAVERAESARLRELARQSARHEEKRPVLAPEQAEILWNNTIGYLDPANLERIGRYGGRAHRGVLLTGSPGNGKTMACRWIHDACHERGWDAEVVTIDKYHTMRRRGDVESLFRVADRGVIFFDDMDLALRNRDTVGETEDQSVFLTALDGMRPKRGVVFVFTTNCPLELIDRAFKRPGRIDVVLPLTEPDAGMRRRLFRRWHADIREHLDECTVVASTDGFSFAEIEEIKNLLVMGFVDRSEWDWPRALDQFATNRTQFSNSRSRVGFADST